MKTIVPPHAELEAIARVADLTGLRVLELGCGQGRMTNRIAPAAGFVLATDPEPQYVSAARAALADDLRERVEFAVAAAEELEVEPGAFDLAFCSWSL